MRRTSGGSAPEGHAPTRSNGAQRTGSAAAGATARLQVPARPLIVTGAIVVVLTVWAAAVRLRAASSLPGTRFDAAWAARIEAHHNPTRDLLAHAIALIGGAPGGVIVDLGVALSILWLYGGAASAVLLASLAINEADVLALKWVSERHPPGSSGLYLGFLGSFPSGHTANAAVLVVAIGLLTRRSLVWCGGFAYVAVMGIDRTYLDAHWVTDTIGGAVAGASVALLVFTLSRPRVRRRWPRRLLQEHRRAASHGGGPSGAPRWE